MGILKVKKGGFVPTTNKILVWGFTLIEVLVVVAIIALLIIMGIWASRLQLLKGRDAKQKADLKKIQIAVEDYEKDKECYPEALPSCINSDSFRPYIEKLPCNSATGANYFYNPQPDTTCPKWYWIFSNLQNDKDNDISKLGCLYGCGPIASMADFNYYVTSPNAPEPYQSSSGGPVPTATGGGVYETRWGYISGTCVEITYEKGIGMSCSPNFTTFEACDLRKDPCE